MLRFGIENNDKIWRESMRTLGSGYYCMNIPQQEDSFDVQILHKSGQSQFAQIWRMMFENFHMICSGSESIVFFFPKKTTKKFKKNPNHWFERIRTGIQAFCSIKIMAEHFILVIQIECLPNIIHSLLNCQQSIIFCDALLPLSFILLCSS